MEYKERALNACAEALRAAEMRQGCTNHSHYATILLNELAALELYEALRELYNCDPELSWALLPQAEEALSKAEGKDVNTNQ